MVDAAVPTDKPLSVVVVEDDPDFREPLVECLQLQGFQVRSAGSALQLYQQLGEQSVDAVIVDLGLPDLDGLSITKFLRHQTSIGIIAMTGDATPENRLRFFERGADLFFAKPLDCRELGAAARSLIQRLRGRNGIPPAAAMPPPDPAKPASDGPAIPDGTAVASSRRWIVDSERWTVSPPGGGAVRLAAKEMRLVSTLAQAAGSTISRDNLRLALGYANTELGEGSLDALIRRVRLKLRVAGAGSSPIQTVHGSGYVFSAPVLVK